MGTPNASEIAQMLTAVRIPLGTGNFIAVGAGTPEGAVTANIGSLYLRTDGGASTTLYVKTSGTSSSGWTAK